jgi:hypothetical protein
VVEKVSESVKHRPPSFPAAVWSDGSASTKLSKSKRTEQTSGKVRRRLIDFHFDFKSF